MLEDRLKNYKTKYEKATIYKICINDMVYFGSTCNFNTRKSNHITHMKNKKNNKTAKLYQFIKNNNVDIENINFNIVKQLKDITKNELDLLENGYIDSVNKDNLLNERKSCVMISRSNYFRNWNMKITCDCGRTMNKGEISKHIKTNIHKRLLEDI
jgi:hypothetical protein